MPRGRLIVSVAGHTLTPTEATMLKHPMLAGVILFSANYKNKEQIRDLIADIQAIADLPIFIDQEGGFVQRFGRGFTCLPAPRFLGDIYRANKDVGLEIAKQSGELMARELAEFGVISLSPVCDLDVGNSVITGFNRSFHKDPGACTALLFAYIGGMQNEGMAATGKHFPGHGQPVGDTHDTLAYDHRSLAEIEASDLVPFIELIKQKKLAAIMPAHIVYTKVDPDHTAGSSKIWLHDLLRGKYGFDGVIVSDCLSMVGAGTGSLLEKTEHALAFGDVAILSHQPVEDVMRLLNDLQAKNYAMSVESEQRFNRWVVGSIFARQILAASRLTMA